MADRDNGLLVLDKSKSTEEVGWLKSFQSDFQKKHQLTEGSKTHSWTWNSTYTSKKKSSNLKYK